MQHLRRTTAFLRNNHHSIPSKTLSILLKLSSSTSSTPLPQPSGTFSSASRTFCTRRSSDVADVAEFPAPVDHRSLLQENEFHELADTTIHHLLEKLEEYGDSVDVDGFDIDYGNEVLTLKLGSLGTYVVNKQTPNRQIWLSSPVSGPSRFDWDRSTQAWIYRRNKASLYGLLESELEKLCGEPVSLS